MLQVVTAAAAVPKHGKHAPHRLASCHPGPWLTIAQLAEHLTVDQSCGYQSVLGSIPSGEIAAEKCLGKILFAAIAFLMVGVCSVFIC